jgi:citrate lyase beta subunit
MQSRVRSALYVPAHSHRYLDWALEARPDAVIVDLEDGVAPPEKFKAREQAPEFVAKVRQAGLICVLRINGTETEFFTDDVKLAAAIGPDVVQLPKGGVAAAQTYLSAWPGENVPSPIWSMVETLRDALRVEELGSMSSVEGLVLGYGDLCKELNVSLSDAHPELTGVRRLVSEFARESARIALDGVHFGEASDSRSACTRSRAAGFGGRTLYDARHVIGCHAAYTD